MFWPGLAQNSTRFGIVSRTIMVNLWSRHVYFVIFLNQSRHCRDDWTVVWHHMNKMAHHTRDDIVWKRRHGMSKIERDKVPQCKTHCMRQKFCPNEFFYLKQLKLVEKIWMKLLILNFCATINQLFQMIYMFTWHIQRWDCRSFLEISLQFPNWMLKTFLCENNFLKIFH